jgi:hypothetical protein
VKSCCIVHPQETLLILLYKKLPSLAGIKSRKDSNRNIGLLGFRKEEKGLEFFPNSLRFFPGHTSNRKNVWHGERQAMVSVIVLNNRRDRLLSMESVMPTIKTGGTAGAKGTRSLTPKKG